MTRTPTVNDSVRFPARQQRVPQRPIMRLVGGAEDPPGQRPIHRAPHAPVRPLPEADVPALVDEQDAERWDGMA